MEEEQNNGNGTNGTETQTPAVMPSSTTNVTTRKLAATLLGVYQKIDGKKADKVTSENPNGHLADFDDEGNLHDSGLTPSNFATSVQGGKADTAVQSVKMVSNSGTELNNNTSVIIPLAAPTGTGASPGLMSAADKKKLDDIAPGAQVNQNAFSNIKVGSTTISADSVTDTVELIADNHITLTPNTADDTITIATDLESKAAASGGNDVSLVTTGEKATWNAKQNALSFDGTYNASSNQAATVSSVTSRINALDVAEVGGDGKYIKKIKETDGKISATVETMDTTPTANSTKAVTSGGIASALDLKANLASPAFTGTPTAPTATTGTNTTQVATTEFVNNEIAAKMAETDAMIYKGTINGGSTGSYGALTGAANKGWTYKVAVAGKIDGVDVEVGDMLICNTDNTAAATSSNYSTIKNNWDFIQTNIDGYVIGPDSSTANKVAGFADATGKNLKQLSAAEVKSAAGLSNVANTNITVSATDGVKDNTNNITYKYTHPTTDAATAAAVKVGRDALGHVVLGAALTASDIGLGNVVNTGDSDTPAADGKEKFTTGGAYTELEKKVDKETGKGLSSNDFTDAYKTKLDGIAAGAEVNQNAFSNVKVGSGDSAPILSADSKTDTLNIIGGTHLTVTGTDNTDTLQISTDLDSLAAAQNGGDQSLVTTGEKYTWNSKADGSHTHGNITNAGAITSDTTIGSGDKIVITDSSGSSKVARSPITFDGSTTTTALTPKGTWESFAKSSEITSAVNALDATVTSSDGTNVQVKVTETDGKITAVNITTDNTENRNNKVTSLTSWSSTTTDTHYPSEKLVKDSLDEKADKVSGATNGNFAALDATGNLTDSGKSASDFSDSHHGHGNITEGGLIQSSGAAALSNGCAIVYTDQNNQIKKSTVTFDATSDYKALTQKGTFETMVKNVKLAGASSNLTNSSGTVTIPNAVATGASGATNGLMTAADKLKLDNLDNVHLGQGYGTCSTAAATAAKAVTLSGYELTTGGIVAVKFTNGLCANATLNINSKGAKNIFINGATVTATTCKNVLAGDIAYFIYDGTRYQFLGTDRTRASVDYDSTNKKITQTIDGVTSDVVSVATIKSDLQLTKSDVGLGNVDNTADADKNVLSATKLTTASNIEGISFNGTANIHRYGTCSTAAGTAAKAVTLSDSMTFTLATGASVFVKFANSNTVANPTLNVNSTGAKSIKVYGTTAPGTSAKTSWQAGSVVHLVYDGSYWQMVNWLNDDSTYTNPSLGNVYGTCNSVEYYTVSMGAFGTVSYPVCDITVPADYVKTPHGMVAVKFTVDVPGTVSPAGCIYTFNGGTGTIEVGQTITYRGSASFPAGIINSGDTAYFVTTTDGKLALLSTDRTRADVNYDSTNKKITKTIDGVTSDVVSVATLKTALAIKNAEYGQGYGTCATAAATTTKAVTLSNYVKTEGGIVAVKFDYAVPSGASLNINSKGADPIYYSGASITGEIIQAGDIATFMYSNSKYILLSVDRSAGEMTDQEVQDLIDALN